MREVTVQTYLYLDCIKYPDGVSEHIEIVASIEAANGNIFPYVSEVVTNSPIPMQVCYIPSLKCM